jgi:hypothetical protein
MGGGRLICPAGSVVVALNVLQSDNRESKAIAEEQPAATPRRTDRLAFFLLLATVAVATIVWVAFLGWASLNLIISFLSL